MSADIEVAELKDQFARWEREKRLVLQIGGVVFVICLGLFVRSTCLPSRSETVIADRIILKDDAGVVRAQLKLDEQGLPRFQMFDSQGREQFGLRGLSNNSTEMAFFGNGIPRATILTPADGHASLKFHDHGLVDDTETLSETQLTVDLDRPWQGGGSGRGPSMEAESMPTGFREELPPTRPGGWDGLGVPRGF